MWGTADGDNIVWGTAVADDVIWGTGDGDNIVWGTATTPTTLSEADGATQSAVGAFDSLTDEQVLDLATLAATTIEPEPPTMTIDSTPIVIDPDSTTMPSGDIVIGLDVPITIVPITIAPTVAIILPGGGF